MILYTRITNYKFEYTSWIAKQFIIVNNLDHLGVNVQFYMHAVDWALLFCWLLYTESHSILFDCFITVASLSLWY